MLGAAGRAFLAAIGSRLAAISFTFRAASCLLIFAAFSAFLAAGGAFFTAIRL
jgi:hypothetical protein